MKVKYFALDGTEQIVDVPDDIKQLNITLEAPVPPTHTTWPAALVLITFAVCFTVLLAVLFRG